MRPYPYFFMMLIGFTIMACAQSNKVDKELQIATAVLAAPEELRADATIYGYDASNEMILLKEGSNYLICTADDPNQEGFSVACYHKDLESFMKRGRELRAEGKNRQEVFDTREEEAKAGTLKMPEQPTTLHIYSGQNAVVDPETASVTGAVYRYVVYIPFATAASTGLPTEPIIPGGPWIMDPGTHRAHIMITPPKVEEESEN